MELFLRYLDYFRSQLVEKIEQLPETEARHSRVPSGWTPLELLKHLTFVEMRWLEWGFEGRAVAEPWGDERDGSWYVAETESLEDLPAGLRIQATRSRTIIEAKELSAVGQPGPR